MPTGTWVERPSWEVYTGAQPARPTPRAIIRSSSFTRSLNRLWIIMAAMVCRLEASLTTFYSAPKDVETFLEADADFIYASSASSDSSSIFPSNFICVFLNKSFKVTAIHVLFISCIWSRHSINFSRFRSSQALSNSGTN